MNFIHADAVQQFGRAGKVSDRHMRIGPQVVNGNKDIRIGDVFEFVILIFRRFNQGCPINFNFIFITVKERRQVIAGSGDVNLNLFLRCVSNVYPRFGGRSRTGNIGDVNGFNIAVGCQINFSLNFKIIFKQTEFRQRNQLVVINIQGREQISPFIYRFFKTEESKVNRHFINLRIQIDNGFAVIVNGYFGINQCIAVNIGRIKQGRIKIQLLFKGIVKLG